MTTPSRQQDKAEELLREVEDMLAKAEPDRLRRLIDDIYDIPPWWAQEPMGRA